MNNLCRVAFCEATNGELNLGKFGVFAPTDLAYSYRSVVTGARLLESRGWAPGTCYVADLETLEGAAFVLPNDGDMVAELAKHRIWVCPMYEPFLVYLAKLPDPLAVPPLVNLPDAPFAFRGYRRAGPTLPEAPLFYTADDLVLCGVHVVTAFERMKPPYLATDAVESRIVQADAISAQLLNLRCFMCGRVPREGRVCARCATPLHPQWPAALCSRECAEKSAGASVAALLDGFVP